MSGYEPKCCASLQPFLLIMAVAIECLLSQMFGFTFLPTRFACICDSDTLHRHYGRFMDSRTLCASVKQILYQNFHDPFLTFGAIIFECILLQVFGLPISPTRFTSTCYSDTLSTCYSGTLDRLYRRFKDSRTLHSRCKKIVEYHWSQLKRKFFFESQMQLQSEVPLQNSKNTLFGYSDRFNTAAIEKIPSTRAFKILTFLLSIMTSPFGNVHTPMVNQSGLGPPNAPGGGLFPPVASP
jgi:hypothetical protein